MNVNELVGKYRARATDSGLGKASTGTEQVAIVFELTGDGAERGLKITWYGYFSDKAYESTVKGLRACGWQGNDPTELDNFQSSGLDANEVELVVEQETALDQHGNANGVRSKVRWVNAPGSIGLKSKLSPDETKNFATRMKAKILAMEQGKPKASASRAPEPPPHTDSDAPPF